MRELGFELERFLVHKTKGLRSVRLVCANSFIALVSGPSSMQTLHAYWSVLDRRARILAIGGALALGVNSLLDRMALLVLVL